MNINKEIEEILTNKKLKYFVKWYVDGQKKEEYEEKVQKILNINHDKAMSTYLEREDVKAAISVMIKNKKDLNLINIYTKMLERSLEGDVQAANWVVKFSESEFFKSKENEIDKIIGGLEIE